jgi:hypothetical protein
MYLFIGADLLMLPLACLPMRWARSRPYLRWLYGLFVLLLAAAVVGTIGLAVDAQRSGPFGAIQVLVYLGPAALASAMRLAYEGSGTRRRRAPEPRIPS